jgi:hypothetical protein
MADKATGAGGTAPAKDRTSWTVQMKTDKVTKNALRYNEVEVKGQAPMIGQLYIQKHAVPDAPDTITVTVSF